MGLSTQGLTLEGGGAYSRNSLSVSKYGGIIHRRAYIVGGAYMFMAIARLQWVLNGLNLISLA
jgi:hypothetical protein